jgi:CO/xanthine dehydrogenase FAD-binding subunit
MALSSRGRWQELEAFLQNKQLDGNTINQMAELAGEDAQPLSHNDYKVPLIKGILKEALTGLR